MINNKLIKPLLIVFLVVYFLYLLLSRAPAELAASMIHKAVPDLWLTGVTGSVWEGSASGAQVDVPGSTLPLGRLDWKLSPLSLLTLSPCVNFEASGTPQVLSGKGCYGITGTVSLKNVNIEAPAAPLSDRLNVPVSGIVSLQLVRGSFQKNIIKSLDAQVSWQNGSLNLGNGWLNLGTYGGKLSEDGSGGLKADLFDVDAPIKIQMAVNGALAEDMKSLARWQLDGTVEFTASAPALFKEYIGAVAEEKEPGVYHVIISSE